MTNALEIDGLRKRYGDVEALKGVSLTVPEGAFFGLLGPNGAGKTTFINVLVGLVRASGGDAYVFGNHVEDDYREARDRIGLAPQEFNVDRFFPIHEVLEHKAGYHGVSEDVAAERAERALKRVGIWDKRDTRFDWLSGGMKRRFMLARALVTDPDLLILDEPTAGVDVQLRRDLWELVTELNDDGTTVLLTTHYIEEAERLCDEVAILDAGEVVTVASPEELMDRGPRGGRGRRPDRARRPRRRPPGRGGAAGRARRARPRARARPRGVRDRGPGDSPHLAGGGVRRHDPTGRGGRRRRDDRRRALRERGAGRGGRRRRRRERGGETRRRPRGG